MNHVGERQFFKMRKSLTYFEDDVKDMPQLKLNPDMLKHTFLSFKSKAKFIILAYQIKEMKYEFYNFILRQLF